MNVVYTDAALSDLGDIADYLLPRNATAAANVEGDIRAAIGRLSAYPFSGRRQ